VDIDARPADDRTRRRATERLRRLADLWPSLDEEERALLEAQLHQLREKASA
jgi:hypothetical protein